MSNNLQPGAQLIQDLALINDVEHLKQSIFSTDWDLTDRFDLGRWLWLIIHGVHRGVIEAKKAQVLMQVAQQAAVLLFPNGMGPWLLGGGDYARITPFRPAVYANIPGLCFWRDKPRAKFYGFSTKTAIRTLKMYKTAPKPLHVICEHCDVCECGCGLQGEIN